MKKLFLSLLIVAGATSCTKNYYETVGEVPAININIDNNQNLSNSNSNSNVINTNVSNEAWSDALSNADQQVDVEASLSAYQDALTRVGDNNGDGIANADDVVAPTRTGFGFVTSQFGVTSNANDGTAYNKYNPNYSVKANLNNWYQTVIGNNNYATAAIGDLDMLEDGFGSFGDQDAYEHKMDTTARPFYIYNVGDNLNDVVSGTVSAVAIIETSAQQLYLQGAPAILLAEGNYAYAFLVPADDDGIMEYLPFALSGEFRVYGQNYTVQLVADTDWSYFTVDKAVGAGNGQLADLPIAISPDNGTTWIELNDEENQLIHVDGLDEYYSESYYVYVNPNSNYSFRFNYLDENGDAVEFVNTTDGLTITTHYHCILNINISDDSNGQLGLATVQFPDFGWDVKEIVINHGGINLKEVFFNNNPGEYTFADEVFVVEADFAGAGADRWYVEGLCGYIVTDGQTPIQQLTIVTESGSATIDNTEGETALVAAALTFIYEGCDVSTIPTVDNSVDASATSGTFSFVNRSGQGPTRRNVDGSERSVFSIVVVGNRVAAFEVGDIVTVYNGLGDIILENRAVVATPVWGGSSVNLTEVLLDITTDEHSSFNDSNGNGFADAGDVRYSTNINGSWFITVN